MELTEKQQEGLEIAINRYKNKEKYTIISGYAGTREIYSCKIYYFCF